MKLFFSIVTLVGLMGIGYANPAVNLTEPLPVKRLASPVYVGVGVASATYLPTNYEDVTYGAMFRAGYEYNQYFGIEARYMATYWSDNGVIGKQLEHFGVFLKPMMPFNENFNIYGLLGYAWTQTGRSGGVTESVDNNGLSVGVGLEFDLSDKRADYDRNIYYPEGFDGQGDQEMGWGLFIDYQRLLLDSDFSDMDVVSAGVTFDF